MRRVSLVLALLLLGACGGGSGGGSGAKPTLTVSAAASLKQAFTQYAAHFGAATMRGSFAGSDALAAQIQQGVKPDIFAAANTKLPDELYAKGLVEKPVVFAANRLVLAVPAAHAKVRSLADLERPGVTIAMGSRSVPVGAYTRKVLSGLPGAAQKALLANVRSNEPDVAGVVGKVAEGAVDAGFVYVTDVKASGGKLSAIELPAGLQPRVAYAAAVVKGAKHPVQASEFLQGLLHGAGRSALLHAGFEPPPTG
jgi:molybdate transport system substrate-binding protein